MSGEAASWRRDAAIVVAGLAIFVLHAAILSWMGQPAINPDGNIDVWGDLAHSRHILDWYTPSHVVHGFLFYGALWLVARRWSIDQRGIGAIHLSQLPIRLGESHVHIAGDRAIAAGE